MFQSQWVIFRLKIIKALVTVSHRNMERVSFRPARYTQLTVTNAMQQESSWSRQECELCQQHVSIDYVKAMNKQTDASLACNSI